MLGVALLLAFAVGAGAAAMIPVFGFMAGLMTVFVIGSLAAAASADSVATAMWDSLAMFVLAQIGYGCGLAAMAGVSRFKATRRPPPGSPWRSRPRDRK